MKEDIIVDYAMTHDELMVKMFCYHHDHARVYYYGLMVDVPENLVEHIDIENYNNFVFIVGEDIPPKRK